MKYSLPCVPKSWSHSQYVLDWTKICNRISSNSTNVWKQDLWSSDELIRGQKSCYVEQETLSALTRRECKCPLEGTLKVTHNAFQIRPRDRTLDNAFDVTVSVSALTTFSKYKVGEFLTSLISICNRWAPWQREIKISTKAFWSSVLCRVKCTSPSLFNFRNIQFISNSSVSSNLTELPSNTICNIFLITLSVHFEKLSLCGCNLTSDIRKHFEMAADKWSTGE